MKKIYLVITILILFSLNFNLILAATPYIGSLHQHTGYSTEEGFTLGWPTSDDYLIDKLNLKKEYVK